MLVEDDENDVELLQLAFRLMTGLSLEVFANGREAANAIISRAQSTDVCWPDVILCDLKMPTMNGFEFLAWLKSESPCPRTPLVVLTSSLEESDVGRAYDLGAAAYLEKPLTHESLQSPVKALVNFWKLVHTPALRREQ
jgi:CheY-like chemotaxis protein